ncbi:transcription factor jumonji (jmj) family protein / zinc finger (C5HC2 type) family protein [Artemisia annua]|uniref:Transcription factor jumonji (Jmj) family protein / zinc finger (C5HC2 type) family protein n=1 Tax=Artemisia annua TaxID=35608 RepID=A0A2U1QMU1_ARTAN|nr:transcription factor jumonji (jmj) family protein / zinc finger (C5HC2 type) family protein [Artemisia annua]
MEEDFGRSVKREGFMCFSDLYLSGAGCSCSPDKYSCLEHSKQICTCPWSSRFFLYRSIIDELNLLIGTLNGKEDMKVSYLRHGSEMEKKIETLARITTILKGFIKNMADDHDIDRLSVQNVPADDHDIVGTVSSSERPRPMFRLLTCIILLSIVTSTDRRANIYTDKDKEMRNTLLHCKKHSLS